MPRRTNSFQQIIAMVVTLLEDGAQVTESVLFPDPVTGEPREVDIVVVRGKLGGKQIQIGIECTDLTRKATVPWVEAQWAKHSRLQRTDFVILVSASGFTGTARKVAEALGYKPIHPNITESELAAVVASRFQASMKPAVVRWEHIHISVSDQGLIGKALRGSDGPDRDWFLEEDGTRLVTVDQYQREATMPDLTKRAMPLINSKEAFDRQFTIPILNPSHEGKRLYIRATDGESEGIQLVEQVRVTVRVSANPTTDLSLTQIGDYGGNQFATGSSPTVEGDAHFVVTEVDGVEKLLMRMNFLGKPLEVTMTNSPPDSAQQE